MENKSQLHLVHSSVNHNITLDNNYLDQVYLIYPHSDLTFNMHVNVQHEQNVNLSVIVLNYANYDVKVVIDVELFQDSNKANVSTLAYGLDKSKTQTTSNFIVHQNSNNNVVHQKIKGFLFNSNARILGEPNLRINSLNVVAKHSLSIGSIDNNEIFYLETKGINKTEAKKIITNSYLHSLIKNLSEKDQQTCVSMIDQGLA